MERWEHEIVEFKEAKSGYDTDKIGRYFSAISNEANLRNQQYGWLVFGVSEKDKVKHVVGTAYKKGDKSLLEKFKYEIARDTTNGMTFYDIIELEPIVNGKELRVLMFKIPAAATGIPTDWKTNYYERSGESLVPLKQYKIDAIRSQERKDWSKQVIEGATIDNLDQGAIRLAREKYKEKMAQEPISKEVDGMSDEQFLTKMKLLKHFRLLQSSSRITEVHSSHLTLLTSLQVLQAVSVAQVSMVHGIQLLTRRLSVTTSVLQSFLQSMSTAQTSSLSQCSVISTSV